MKISLKNRIKISQFFPENLNDIIEALKIAGFSGHAFRTQSQEFMDALPNDDIAIRHFLAFCDQGPLSFPIDLNLEGYQHLTRARIWNRPYLAHLLSNLLNAHLITNPASAFDPEFWRAIIQALRRVSRPYFIIGDSHSQISCAVGKSLFKPILPIHILCTGGSAIGLCRENSRSQYGARIARVISALSSADPKQKTPIWFQFGQVDLEFVYNFRRIKAGELELDRNKLERFCDEVIADYSKFLTSLRSTYKNTHLLSVFPPTLSDQALSAGYMNAHIAYLEFGLDGEEIRRPLQALKMPNLYERTCIHRMFNDKMQIMREELGINFVNVLDLFIGDAGVVDRRFAPNSDHDHHMDVAMARPYMCGTLERAMAPLLPWR